MLRAMQAQRGQQSKSQRRRWGIAAVEMAFALPFLAMLVWGIIEFGRAMLALESIANASRNGARKAVQAAGDYDAARAAVLDSLQTAGISGTPVITIKVNGTTVTSSSAYKTAAVPGARVSVEVAVPYRNVSWLPGNRWLLSDTNLMETTTMRREG